MRTVSRVSQLPEMVIQCGNLSRLYPLVEPWAATVSAFSFDWAVAFDGMFGGVADTTVAGRAVRVAVITTAVAAVRAVQRDSGLMAGSHPGGSSAPVDADPGIDARQCPTAVRWCEHPTTVLRRGSAAPRLRLLVRPRGGRDGSTPLGQQADPLAYSGHLCRRRSRAGCCRARTRRRFQSLGRTIRPRIRRWGRSSWASPAANASGSGRTSIKSARSRSPRG